MKGTKEFVSSPTIREAAYFPSDLSFFPVSIPFKNVSTFQEKEFGLFTSFVRKGRAAKDEPLRKVLRSELSKERATRLEGSFGTQKQHYSLSRIKARNRKTEILWIFFGIHTANAVLMIDKITDRTAKAA